MRRTFKYRAYLTVEQQKTAIHWMAVTRNVYNASLEQRVEWWRRKGQFTLPKSPERKATTVSFYGQTKELTQIRKVDEEVRGVPYTVVRDTALIRADRAYKAYIRILMDIKSGKIKPEKQGKNGKKRRKQNFGKPNFRKAWTWNSLNTEQPSDLRLAGNILKFSAMRDIKLRLHRPLLGRMKACCIKKEADGWYAAISCEDVPLRNFPHAEGTVGIHLGLRKLIWLDSGKSVPNPLHILKGEKKLKSLRRILSRRQKFSNRWRKVKNLIARAEQKVARQREHFLRKWAYRIVSKYGSIGIEKWRVQKLIQHEAECSELRKLIHDAAWAKFWQMIKNVGEEAGRKVIEVPYEATTQTCSQCGHRQEVKPEATVYDCEECKYHNDRDINSAKVVRNLMSKYAEVSES